MVLAVVVLEAVQQVRSEGMRVVRVQVACSSCGHEWESRKVEDECPQCWLSQPTGWSQALEDEELRKWAGQAFVV